MACLAFAPQREDRPVMRGLRGWLYVPRLKLLQQGETPVSSATQDRPLGYEANGINVISEGERKGRPRDLFWPWFAANISVLGLAYGSFELGFGISFWQALIVGVAGIVLSFLACGFIAVAGKRGSGPTIVLRRGA